MAVVTFVNVCYLTLAMRVTNIGTNFSAKTFEKDYSLKYIFLVKSRKNTNPALYSSIFRKQFTGMAKNNMNGTL